MTPPTVPPIKVLEDDETPRVVSDFVVSCGLLPGAVVSGEVVSGGLVSDGVVSGGVVTTGFVTGGVVTRGVVTGGLGSSRENKKKNKQTKKQCCSLSYFICKCTLTIPYRVHINHAAQARLPSSPMNHHWSSQTPRFC